MGQAPFVVVQIRGDSEYVAASSKIVFRRLGGRQR
jgi:hypothetical protein